MHVSAVLVITKMAGKLSRWLGRGGGQALPGLLAERLDPQLAQKLAAGLPRGVILVTGTNGKTTTTKLIKDLLEAQGERVLVNSTGSNLKRGVVSALIAAADVRGRLDATVGLFEVDEASLRRVAPLVRPQHIVVLNLFRDQLDRYGELDTTAALIGQGIAATQAQAQFLHLLPSIRRLRIRIAARCAVSGWCFRACFTVTLVIIAARTVTLPGLSRV
jgi:UDP-N-acetylmuramyl tripeptide synthase